MGIARIAGTVALCFVAVTGARAQGQTLAETPLVNDCYRVHIAMQLKGEMVVLQENKPVSLKLAATAEHRYHERVLAVLPQGSLVAKMARHYDDARATISIDGSASMRSLRADRRLIVAQRQNDTATCYSPQGPLTREELDTVSEHFDTACLAGLLPGKQVKPGDTWKIGNACVQGLCQFEGLIANDVTGKLVDIKDGMAVIVFEGTTKGIELGAQAQVKITATGRYDLGRKRLASLEWKQADTRDQGPASPAANVETTITLTREVVPEPKELSDVALVGVPQGFDLPAPLTNLVIRDLKDRFELASGREWQVVSQTENHLVVRLLERGDFVAQATVTPWQKAEAGKHMEPKDFREAMLSTPGWEPQEVFQEGGIPNQPNGRFVYRVSARGQMEDVKVVQTFFLVAGPKGDQCIVAITLKQAQLNKLGARDLILVEGLELLTK